jgi:DNA gyrase subunit A
LTITENGYGKRTQIKAYRKTNRGGIGVANLKITEKNGKVVQSLVVSKDDEIIVTSKRGMIIRMRVQDIPVKKGRAVMGVRVMRLRTGDRVMAIAKMVSEKEAEEVAEEEEAPKKPLKGKPPKGRKRGRPRKEKKEAPKPKRKRGRPRKK